MTFPGAIDVQLDVDKYVKDSANIFKMILSVAIITDLKCLY